MQLQFGVSSLSQHHTSSVYLFISPLRADITRRGFAIYFLTLASVAAPDFFLAFFFIEHP
jgi:hypothetical protein